MVKERFGAEPVVTAVIPDRGVIAVLLLLVAFALMVTVVPLMPMITALAGMPVPLMRIPTRRLVVLLTPVMLAEPVERVPVTVLKVRSAMLTLKPATPLSVLPPPR